MSSATVLTTLRARIQQMRAPALPNPSGQNSSDFGTSVRNFLTQTLDCLRLHTPIWGDAALAANTNNLAFALANGLLPNTIRLDNTAGGAIDLTGIVAPTTDQPGFYYLVNVSSDSISLKNENAGSSAPNRFLTPGGADVVLGLNNPVHIAYDPDATRWRVLST